MASQWSIRILDAPEGTVVFWPWVPGAKPGDPLYAKASDVVTWNNTSASEITLISDPSGTYITGSIPSGQVSSPMFQVPANGIAYQTSDGKAQHSISTKPPPAPSV